MTATLPRIETRQSTGMLPRRGHYWPDRAFQTIGLAMAVAILVVAASLLITMARQAVDALQVFGPGARAEGRVLLHGQDVYSPDTDPVALRRVVGMVFQRPNPFPTMSILDNVLAGLRLGPRKPRSEQMAAAEESLRRAALWTEVKDKLREPGVGLSGGQQQRLCIARALAVEPDVLLMDEPCSALDPIATLRIEELIRELRNKLTIVIVTHNMQQAARVSDLTTFLLAGEERVGELVEVGPTKGLFTNPTDRRTEDYITGRFG